MHQSQDPELHPIPDLISERHRPGRAASLTSLGGQRKSTPDSPLFGPVARSLAPATTGRSKLSSTSPATPRGSYTGASVARSACISDVNPITRAASLRASVDVGWISASWHSANGRSAYKEEAWGSSPSAPTGRCQNHNVCAGHDPFLVSIAQIGSSLLSNPDCSRAWVGSGAWRVREMGRSASPDPEAGSDVRGARSGRVRVTGRCRGSADMYGRWRPPRDRTPVRTLHLPLSVPGTHRCSGFGCRVGPTVANPDEHEPLTSTDGFPAPTGSRGPGGLSGEAERETPGQHAQMSFRPPQAARSPESLLHQGPSRTRPGPPSLAASSLPLVKPRTLDALSTSRSVTGASRRRIRDLPRARSTGWCSERSGGSSCRTRRLPKTFP